MASSVPVLIRDLALILCTAGFTTIIFKYLKQPVVLGYILAGFIVGANVQFFPTIKDTVDIKLWADIGVIFLLFALGLDFSFRKLLRVGATALIGAGTVVIGMMSLGYLVGQLMGWSFMNSLFLGGMLSMSSTMIIIKAVDDLGLRNKGFTGVVFGVLVVEDLFAVLLMVLLSTLAVSRTVEGSELAQSVFKLGAFLFFIFMAGIYILPSFFKKVRGMLNDETLLLLSLAFCLGMVIIAVYAGFSFALGAFLMGSVLAETLEAERIEHMVKPLKNLFGAIFFVSVGMMIEPELLVQYFTPILILTIVVVVGQIFFATIGILISGQPLKIAVQSGFSLAQIGEFAFIIAGLGISLKVTDAFLYPIVVAVSVITTFLTPFLMRLSEPFYYYLEKKLPPSVLAFLNRYASIPTTLNQQTLWKQFLKSLLKIVFIYGTLSLIVIFASFTVLEPRIEAYLPGFWGGLLTATITLVVISPFLRAIMAKKNRSEEFKTLWNDRRSNRAPLVSLFLIRILFCVALVSLIIIKCLNYAIGICTGIAIVFVVLLLFSKRLKKQSIRLEKHFLQNYREKGIEMDRKAPVRQQFVQSLLSRELHLSDFEVRQNSPSVGKTLRELSFRQKCGINIVTILRGTYRINIPGGDERLYPFDKIAVVGTDKQLSEFKKYVDNIYEHATVPTLDDKEISLQQFLIEKDSPFIGKSILSSMLKEYYGCMVVGIERGMTSLLNPDLTVVFEEKDVVWIVGEQNKIEKLVKNKI
ncbi:MAG: cation:proton antiporter [Bacteroidales bacterium]|nr:cation:proton antiporter [Bacteroidales bacterium]